jgi:hypothetical protein
LPQGADHVKTDRLRGERLPGQAMAARPAIRRASAP